MSRFYEIVISDPATGEIFVPDHTGKSGYARQPAGSNAVTYSSMYALGLPSTLFSSNPNALRVELDIPVAPMHQAMQNAYVRISGISLAEMAASNNLNFMNIRVRGGYSKGLPLENPTQIGTLCSGMVLTAFANWIGTAQTLDIYITAGGESPSSNQTTGNPSGSFTSPVPTTNADPANIVFQWQPGQPLMTPIINTMNTAYPQYSITGALNSGLVLAGQAVTAVFQKLSQFADFLNRKSLDIIGGYAPSTAYMGVSLAMRANEMLVFDGSVKTRPKVIAFEDLVGQPTLSAPFTIQATCNMRGDIQVGDYATLATAVLEISSSSNTNVIAPPGGLFSSAKNRIALAGTFLVIGVRHVGNSRQGSGTSWVTIINMLQTQPGDASSTIDGLPTVSKPTATAFSFHLP